MPSIFIDGVNVPDTPPVFVHATSIVRLHGSVHAVMLGVIAVDYINL